MNAQQVIPIVAMATNSNKSETKLVVALTVQCESVSCQHEVRH